MMSAAAGQFNWLVTDHDHTWHSKDAAHAAAEGGMLIMPARPAPQGSTPVWGVVDVSIQQ